MATRRAKIPFAIGALLTIGVGLALHSCVSTELVHEEPRADAADVPRTASVHDQKAPPSQEAGAARATTVDAAAPSAAERANSTDTQTRAAAIVELASVPKDQAVPVLEKVLRTGEPADRQLAIGSLRVLATDQGDSDSVIRNILRQVVYHGDDADVTLGAQAALDDIDRAEQER